MKSLRLDPPEIPVRVHFTADADSAIALPEYKSEFAAGLDVSANFASDLRATGVTLAPGARALIPTGLCIAVPAGFEMQLRPRSGLALAHGITLLNSPGTIDSDYRGEVGVVLINHGQQDFTVEHGARIAQMVLSPVTQCTWVQTDKLGNTKRGRGGFGSTG